MKQMIKSFPKGKEIKEWLNTYCHNEVVLDVETDGLRYGCTLKGISLCNGTNACYINLDNNPYFNIILYLISQALLKCTLLVGHNISFDLKVLKYYGYFFNNDLYDTLVAAHLLNENASCALKDLAVRVLKVPEKEVMEFTEAVKFGYSSEKFLNYGINDSIWTWQLYELTKPRLEKQNLWELFGVEMPFQYVIMDLESNGISIDSTKLEDFEDILKAEKAKLEIDVVESIGLKMVEEKDLFGFTTISTPMNINSDQQVANVIQKTIGIELPLTEPSKMYPNGQPSTSSDVLIPLKEKHPFIKLILKYRSVEKMLNTFILPIREKLYDDGRIRTSFNDCVARTGRLSSSGPNLQNIPVELSDEDIINVRELFVPEEGRVFIKADYDSQELRQLANLTKDPNLIKAFNEKMDLHLFTANNCLGLGIPEEKLVKTHPEHGVTKSRYKKERHIGKNGINFPIVYGSTAYGISKNNNVEEEEAQGWLDGFFALYPEVKKAIRKCEMDIFKDRCVVNYFGRKRRFQLSPNDIMKYRNKRGGRAAKAIRQGFNFLIQGFCADLLRITLVRLRDLYLKNPHWQAKLVLSVHDDIITECLKEHAGEVLEAKKKIMENVVHFDVPFLVDIGICGSYSGKAI